MKNKKDKMYILLLVIAIIVPLVLSVSYAYFQARIIGTDTDVTGKSTNTFDINLITENDGYINATNMLLVKPEEVAEKSSKGIFKVVTGANKHNISYVLSLTDLAISANLQVSDFKWALINTGTSQAVASGTFAGISASSHTLKSGIQIKPNTTHYYELRIWIEETQANQISLAGGTFKGKVSMTADMTSDIAPSLADTILAQGGGATAISAKGNPNFAAIATATDTGLYASADEYGTSYYYRGLKANLNNNLIFANMQWKIVRINGDGSIRIIYNGKCPNNTCTINNTHADTDLGATSILNTGTNYTHVWNTTNSNDNKYTGYMYGGTNGSASGTKTEAQTNTTATNAKTALDAWYVSSIVSQGPNVTSKIVNNIYCNDRQTSTVTTSLDNGGGYGTVTTYYGARIRLQTNKTPTLRCTNKNDRFTVSETTLGNGVLTYPVGLISADEVSMAGLVSGTSNSTNYLYTNQNYWTFSPINFSGFATLWLVSSTAFLSNGIVYNAYGLRPLLNLKSDTTITSGDGSTGTPFVISD